MERKAKAEKILCSFSLFMTKIQRLALHLGCIIVLLLKRRTKAVFYHLRGIARVFSQEK
ncbi:hypothetical protein KZZ20_08970 [Methylacidiphilum fumariolicum]|uniref:Uncharacterized protein n=1 Tax=Candidatus Methylacidiphilum fumarolicum TaxID=591154 RepID=A0ABM9IEB2_9BACT|nr:hypothetical protein [Candidatus Methylacidiphilum fumarolicum]MBW6415639.1 hypothetical protein [Candidatus Methylacidiphilum fumarolicum]CAI9086032.1 protein of unknown function [Candidatus Methylacidiphilum fumarolicum]